MSWDAFDAFFNSRCREAGCPRPPAVFVQLHGTSVPVCQLHRYSYPYHARPIARLATGAKEPLR